jgi:hypothetical protein
LARSKRQAEEGENVLPPAFRDDPFRFFNLPRVDRSSWQVPYPRMGKRSQTIIPMARLGRSSEGLVIPMARLGRSSNPGHSMIPMARLGRSAPEKEEAAPVYLPSSGVPSDWTIQDMIKDPKDLDLLLDVLDEVLNSAELDKDSYPNVSKFYEELSAGSQHPVTDRSETDHDLS